VARSRVHMMELRRDNLRDFGGTYRHTRLQKGDSLTIRLQCIDMFSYQALYDNVLQICV